MDVGDVAMVRPHEFVFQHPLTRSLTVVMEVENVAADPIAFKVKTTAPKRYCVRPNSGFVLPGAHTKVSVVLQPIKDAAPDLKCKDKFLVQAVRVEGPEVPSDFNEWWKSVPASSVMDARLKVHFVPESTVDTGSMASGKDLRSAQVAAAAREEEAARAANGAAAKQQQQQQQPVATIPAPIVSYKVEDSAKEAAAAPVASTADSSASAEPVRMSAVDASRDLAQTSTERDNLRFKLAEAQRKINSLTDQLRENESTLRQRRRPADAGSSSKNKAPASAVAGRTATPPPQSNTMWFILLLVAFILGSLLDPI